MNTFAVAFVGSLVGGVLAGLFGQWADTRYRAPPVELGAANVVRFPRAALLRLTSLIVFFVWSSIVGFFALLSATFLGFFRPPESLVLMALGFMLSCAALYLSLAFILRCPKCQRQVLIQMSSNPPHAEKLWQMDDWASVVVRILFLGCFRCMHCGQRYSI